MNADDLFSADALVQMDAAVALHASEREAERAASRQLGFDEPRQFQRRVLAAWRLGKDALILSGTGSGKSACFQLPSLISGGTGIVVSPLISLMRDQVKALQEKGVRAGFLGSGQCDASVERAACAGDLQLVYLCPETLRRLLPPLRILHARRPFAVIAIDEAHCISAWGHDFRPEYAALASIRQELPGTPLMALTATATPTVRDEICRALGLVEPSVVVETFVRPNLAYSVRHSRCTRRCWEEDLGPLFPLQGHGGGGSCDGGGGGCGMASASGRGIVEEVLNARERDEVEEDDDDDDDDHEGDDDDDDDDESERHGGEEEDVGGGGCSDDQLRPDPNVAVAAAPSGITQRTLGQRTLAPVYRSSFQTIVYVPTRKEAEAIATWLGTTRGVRVAAYHAKLPRSLLAQAQAQWRAAAIDVVVATIAFGMGIDQAGVRHVVHYGWPQSLEAYHQESGRAGRDGLPAQCTLFANLSRMPSLLPNAMRSAARTAVCLQMLLSLYEYAVARSGCRQVCLVTYFGEPRHGWSCGVCDLCAAAACRAATATPHVEHMLVDLSDESRLVLGAVEQLACLSASSPPGSRAAFEDFKCVVNALQGRSRPRGDVGASLQTLGCWGRGAARRPAFWSALARALGRLGLVVSSAAQPTVGWSSRSPSVLRGARLTPAGHQVCTALDQGRAVPALRAMRPDADLVLALQSAPGRCEQHARVGAPGSNGQRWQRGERHGGEWQRRGGRNGRGGGGYGRGGGGAGRPGGGRTRWSDPEWRRGELSRRKRQREDAGCASSASGGVQQQLASSRQRVGS